MATRTSADKKMTMRRAEVLEKLNHLVDALWRRRRSWTRAEREIYESIARSLAKSAVRQQKQRAA